MEAGLAAADVAGETLAVELSVMVEGRDVNLPADAPAEVWHPAAFGTAPEYVGFVAPGTYANQGGFHVAVTRVAS